jgi:hypothetical protein|tara:strand:- start:1825 stop:2439 length:615 start_codon:yes stop_codon:yes gene_type:complete
MRTRGIVLALVVLLALGVAYRVASGARADAVAAEARVQMLEVERLELQLQVEEAVKGYDILVDSLAQAHDSLAKVREGAAAEASRASQSFDRGFSALRDSLGSYDGLVEILDQVQVDHEEVVAAYQVQVQTLESDKALLFKRITALDSMWVLEQQVNKALRTEIVALHEEADAWERLSNTSLLGGFRSAVPYALAGAGIVLLFK